MTPDPITDRCCSSQPVLVSRHGEAYHLPHVNGTDDPVCPTNTGELLKKDLSSVDPTYDPCSRCVDMMENHPQLVSLILDNPVGK